MIVSHKKLSILFSYNLLFNRSQILRLLPDFLLKNDVLRYRLLATLSDFTAFDILNFLCIISHILQLIMSIISLSINFSNSHFYLTYSVINWSDHFQYSRYCFYDDRTNFSDRYSLLSCMTSFVIICKISYRIFRRRFLAPYIAILKYIRSVVVNDTIFS